jgi:phenylpyruvate tautomerase PptA (4-oxalocrotonate tautomerase family)
MPDSVESSASAAGYIVLREVEPGHWHVVGKSIAGRA